MRVLGMRIQRRCIDNNLISPQQHLRLLSSATGDLINSPETDFFVWGPRVSGGQRPRIRLVKKTTVSKVCLRRLFLPCIS